MPALTQVVFYDDMAWPGDRVPAQEVVQVTIVRRPLEGGSPSRKAAELYLTGKHAAEVDAVLSPWLTVGHPLQSGHQRGKTTGHGPAAPAGSAERRDWRRDLRKWSDGLGLVNPDAPQYPAWKNKIGKHSYPADLEEAYDLIGQGKEAEALAKVERFRPQGTAA